MHFALLVVAGYLAGSVPFGVLLTRWLTGTDPRDSGSGNIGATNVARVAGKKLGVVVLLLDAAKGALPVLAALWVAPGEPWLHAAVGLAAFLGHVFSLWLRFKGGKGVATALGVLVVLMPLSALAGFLVFAALFAALRVSSIGSLAGATVAVASSFFLGSPREYSLLGVTLLVLMLYTHRANLSRIVKRTEPKL
jgi:glycerol-3-phosphate acyltransferase PlsY